MSEHCKIINAIMFSKIEETQPHMVETLFNSTEVRIRTHHERSFSLFVCIFSVVYTQKMSTF